MDFETAFYMIWQSNHTLLVSCVIGSALFFSFANRQAFTRKVMHTLGFVGLGIVLEFGRTNLFALVGETYTALPSTYTIVLLLSFAVGDWLSYLIHLIHVKFAEGKLWIELARVLGKIALRFEAYGVHYMPAPKRTVYLNEKEARKKQPSVQPSATIELPTPEVVEKTIIVNDQPDKKDISTDEKTQPINVAFNYQPARALDRV